MTITLLTVFLLTIFAWFFYKEIHRFHLVLYGLFLLLSILFYDEANIVTLGFIPLGFFIVVMYTGILSKGNLKKRLFSVRAEYSVIGFILLLPHAFGYLLYILDELELSFISVQFLLGLISVLLMIPLIITSFPYIRRMINYKTFKKIHAIGYIIYLMVFLHLLLINNQRFYIYLVVGLLYIVFSIPNIKKTYQIAFQKK